MSPREPVERRLGIAEAVAFTGLSKTTIWRLCKEGDFPAPEYLTDRRTWRLSALEAWIADRLARRANRNAPGAQP